MKWMLGSLLVFFAVGVAAFAQNVSSDANALYGDPIVKEWVVPEYPAELKAQKIEGEVAVEMVIDEKGAIQNLRVAHSTDPRFDDAVVKAFNASKFSPAVERDRPIAMGVGVTWYFRLPYNPPVDHLPPDSSLRPLPRTPAKSEFTPDPEYPPALVERQLPGEVLFQLEIDSSGRVSTTQILFASYAEFVQPALKAVKQWTFHPATQGSLAVKDTKRAPLTFFVDGPGSGQGEVLKLNGFTLHVPEGSTAAAVYTVPPAIVAIADPVFPVELLSSGQAGDAEVECTINIQGVPESIQVRSVSLPACGASVVAALEATVFSPAMLHGQAVSVKLIKKQHFALPADTAQPDESEETRLLRLLRGGAKLGGARGLDGKLNPLWRARPNYPDALRSEHPSGSAQIEFVIDSAGRARVPKIISATREEFGWAAATAVSQWVFDPPTREGRPTEVRVQITIPFAPP